VLNWNSGVLYSRTAAASGRNLPEMGDPYLNGGVVDTWILPGVIGTYTAPSYYTLDIRAKYIYKLTANQKIEFFVDVFNLLDKQSPTGVMSLAAGSAVYKFGQANAWVEPRRLYLGARYTF
jgi:hypothetical protein